jgi:hypothetical protein
MGKALFLDNFQENLCKSIDKLIREEWGLEGFYITCEKGNLTGKFNGFIDICIERQGIESSIVAIEIEHLSSYEQAKRNIEKMRAWAHNSNYRKCGFLHVINEESHIGVDYFSGLVRFAKAQERKGLGFYYDFKYYIVSDRRMFKQIAEDLVNSADFGTRLWMLLESVDMV